ncbi:lactate utilization protein [Deferribacter thermophilus]|uniref:lactate utilization protein n=1 Tax=Deferribacter thermophilus TaxID=53573 RepID=UPI003C1C0BBD
MKQKKLNKKILNHGDPNLTPEERNQVRLAELTCDLFVTSTNALTLDGKLVNIDGTGNRVNAMAFGPKKSVVYTGINKIVENVDDAIKRIKFIASPMNAKRLNFNTPCAKTGFCADCNSPQRICRIVTIIEKNPPLSDIEIVIIGESLGF